jgi:PAS domain S-box-containing protein
MEVTAFLRSALALSVAALTPVPLCLAAGDAQSRKVLAIHWGGEDFPTTPPTNARVREVLRSCPGPAVDYHSEYLESDRFPGEKVPLALRDYIRGKYAGERIDAVLVVAHPALDFVLRHRKALFPTSPIVYLGAKTWDTHVRSTGAGLTGLVSHGHYGHTLRLALTLHPTTKRVFVVARAPVFSLRDLMAPELRSVSPGVELTFFERGSVADLLAAVKTLDKDTLVFYVRYSQENEGPVLFPPEISEMVAKASPVPVYTSSTSGIGSGAVGGAVYDLQALATRLGEMICQVLNGTRAQDIPLERSEVTPTFDWRAMQRWGINPSRLPPGSVIRYREPSLWDLYGWYMVGAIALFAVQAFMITALVVQRARRRETEARNAAILRALPDMMFLQTIDGVYVDFHTPDQSQLLARPEQFIGRHMADVLPPELARQFEEHFARLRESRAPRIVEYTLPMPDGEHHYEGRLVPCTSTEVLSVVRDITARKRAEAALSESEERYALATAAGGVGVWDWNLATNDLFVDPSLKAILGYHDDEIKNHLDDWRRHVHPDDAPSVAAAAQAHIDGKSPMFEVEHRMLHRDGSIRWFLARGSAVRRDGVAVRVIGTDTDITERKTSEQALQEAQDELTRVSRLTALGEFAASIAHEVSQPLTAIIMNAKTCLRWLSGTAPDLNEIRAAVWDVVESSRRATDVIRRYRELFRHHTVHKAPVDVNVVIREVSVLARAQLQGNHVALDTSLAEGLPTIVADRVELQQVLLNLIVNAIDAMEGVVPAARHIEIASTLANGDGVRVSVRDNGVGLEGVDMTRMFASSYTTKANGTGVGLAISRSIIEAHGGRLWAEGNPTGGATFLFTVPVQSAASVG